MSGVSLVQFSALDVPKFLKLGRQAFDINLAESADSAGYSPPLHHMMCVAFMKNPQAKTAADIKPYFGLFHAGFMIAADEVDWSEILELAGMQAILTPAIQRGVVVGFISGTITQWRDAVLRGCQKDVGQEARHTYNLIYTEFKNIGLAPAFDVKVTPYQRDHTFLLEHK